MPRNSKSSGKGYSQSRRRRSSGTTQDQLRLKSDHESIFDKKSRTGLKKWLRQEWWVIVGLILIFVLALFLRAFYYYPVATEDGYMLSGNDPFYHKQVIDYVQVEHRHLVRDPTINYPLIGGNPRPPVYDWSSAIAGLALAPFFGGDYAEATWVFFILSPAIWGALTIFPVYFLGKEIFGKKAGLMGALLMGIMASHIERCPAGFADHDAMVLFFVVTSVFFLVKALGALKDKFWIDNWRKPGDIVQGFDDFFKESKVAVGFSIMSGMSIATVALIWKGFPYVFVILLGYFSVQLVFNHIKKTDSLGVFICLFITIATSLMVSFPYYAYFTTGTWMSPLYLLLAMIFVGIFLVPTRDQPWLMVIPTLITIIAAIMFTLDYFAPDIAANLFSGGGYFIRSKLYDTIAEAQAPDMSRLTISYGPVTFYLALIGLVIAAIDIPKQWKPNYMLIILWCGLAIYMAMSAVRFMFNATPVFAILGGWVTWRIVERLDPTFREFQRTENRFIYLYVGVLTLLLIVLSYWQYYLVFEDFEMFQLILGLGLIGMFSSLMALYFISKYSVYIGAAIYGGFFGIWVAFSWTDDYEIFFFGLLMVAMVLLPVIILTALRDRISGFRIDLKHVGIALFLVLLILTPNFWFAIDSAIPYESKNDIDPDGEIFGAFGHSFPSEYWQNGEQWLSEQDTQLPVEDRPAFISWWDYGFWTTYLGQHPTVADNFQAGYQLAGSFIAAQSENEAISLFATRLIEGDYTRNGKKFSPEVREIIIKYYDNGNQNDHPTYDKIYSLMNTPARSESTQNALMDEVENHPEIYGNYSDIKVLNAVYAGIRVIFSRLELETLVSFLHEIETETETRIRYFAVDTRLFPFTAQNTGIFYAPITLADRKVEDFLEYKAYVEYRTYSGGDWLPFQSYAIPLARIDGAMNDIEDIVDEYGKNNVRIQQYVLGYTDMFYNSMFYRCYIGWTGSDVGIPNDAVPGINDNDGNTQLDTYPPLQGWNMTHFRLVYRTAYWNPHNQTELEENEDYQEDWVPMGEHEAQEKINDLETDGIDNNKNGETDEGGEGGVLSSGIRQGVFFLKYYHGAIIKGKVVTQLEPKMPVPGSRVTVVDEFGIPHDVDYTDKDGNYELIAPFGTCQVVVSQGGFDQANPVFGKLSNIEQRRLAVETIEITDAQAMRTAPNYIIEKDFEVTSATYEGKVHWDNDDNEEYNEDTDELITELEVELELVNTITNLNITYEPTELGDGEFKFENVIPGEYIFTSEIAGHAMKVTEKFTVQPGASLITQNVSLNPSTIEGMIEYDNGTPAGGLPIALLDKSNDTYIEQNVADNGTYKFTKLIAGEYSIIIDEPDFMPVNESIDIEEGDIIVINLTLIDVAKVTGKTWYDKNYNGFDNFDLIPHVKIYFKNLDNNFNTTTYSDLETAEFEVDLTEGNYTVYARHVLNEESYVHLTNYFIKAGTELEISIELEDSFKLNGTVYKLVAQEVQNATITFESPDPAGNLSQLSVPTNYTGDFRVYLPYREYLIKGYHLSSGGVPYLYFSNMNYTTITPARAIDIKMEEASRPWGFVYWDRNEDGNLSLINTTATAPGGVLDATDLTLTPGGIPIGTGEVEVEETQQTGSDGARTKYPGTSELISGLNLKFTHINGTVTVLTNDTGYYETYLPPGKNYISIDDERFEPLSHSMDPERVVITVPENGEFIDGIMSDITVIPRQVEIKGTLWFDSNDNNKFDTEYNEHLSGIPIDFQALTEGAQDTEVTTKEDTGEYAVRLMPGLYRVTINFTDEFGDTGKFEYTDNISVPFYSSAQPEYDYNIQLTPIIKIDYTVIYQNEVLNSTTAGDNLTIKFVDFSNNIQSPLNATEDGYEGYVEAHNYSVMVEYAVEEQNQTVKYINLDTHIVRPGTGSKIIDLSLGTEIEGKTYVDKNYNGFFDPGEDEPAEISELVFTRMSDGSRLVVNTATNGDYQVYLTPAENYEVTINYSTDQTLSDNEFAVKYTFEDQLQASQIDDGEIYNIPVTKHIRISGTVYFDKNDNGVQDSEEGLNNSIIKFKPLGQTVTAPITTVTNATGYYELFLEPDGYEITIELFGFRSVPDYKNSGGAEVIEYDKFELLQLEINEVKPEIDLILLPTLVEVSGKLFYDKNLNNIIDSSEMSLGKDIVIEFIPEDYRVNIPTYYEFSSSSVLGPENEDFKNSLREKGENTLNQITVVKPVRDRSDAVNYGTFSVFLTPGTYNIYAYSNTQSSGQLYAALDQIELLLFEDSEHNLSMNKGMEVTGNVYYQDTDGDFVYDTGKTVSEGGLTFTSKDTEGKLVLGYEGGFYSTFLGYGNYSISTSYQSEEYEKQMTYSVSKTLWIKETEPLYDIKLTKSEKYDLFLDSIGEYEKTISRGGYEKGLFTLEVKNDANVKTNIINLEVQNAPAGWDIKLDPSSVSLGLLENEDTATVEVDVNAPLNALAENLITIRASSKEGSGTGTIELNVNTPKLFEFDVYSVEDTDRGINPNSSLNINITVELGGNTGDAILFDIQNIPTEWNATLEAGGIVLEDDGRYRHTYAQEEIEMVYKNISLKFRSPEISIAGLYKVAQLKIVATSENTSRSETLDIRAEVRDPDLTVSNIELINVDLAEGNNITIQATLRSSGTEAHNVPSSLYINDEFFENRTIIYIPEDGESMATFEWRLTDTEVEELAGKDQKFEVVVNGDQIITESQPYNNVLNIEHMVGPPEEEEEFNWRPLIAVIIVVAAVIVALAFYQRSKKI